MPGQGPPPVSGPQVKASEAALSRVRSFIETGGFRPGDTLPSERDLAKRFQVSRHTLREALRVMEARGVLLSRRGSGTYIAPVSAARLRAALTDCLRSERATVHEIFQFRQLLEPQVAALAAVAATGAQIAALRALVERQAATRSDKALNEIDTRFHTLIAEATGNSILGDMTAQITRGLREIRAEHRIDDLRRDLSLQGHRVLIDALARRDADGAQAAMRDHIAGIGNMILARYDAAVRNRTGATRGPEPDPQT